MITTSRQFADVFSGAPRVASRPRWYQSSNDFLYRNSVPCFLSWCPFPSRVVTQFDSLSLSFADPWWKVIHDFSCIYTPWFGRILSSLSRYGAWIAMGCEVASGPPDRCLGEWPHGPVIRRREDCATLRCKQQRMPEAAVMLEEVAKRTPPHPATLPLERN